MAKLESRIRVDILLNARAITRAVFTVPAVMGFPTFAERFRTYSDETSVAADTELDASTRAALNTGFKQKPKPSKIVAGRLDALVKQKITLTIVGAPAEDDVYALTLDGEVASYTAGSGEAEADVVDGLVLAIGGLTRSYTVVDGGDSLTVESATAGDPFLFSMVAEDPSAFTLVETTANVSVTDGLDAVRAAGAKFTGFTLTSRERVASGSAAAWAALNGYLFCAQDADANAVLSGNTDNTASDFATLDPAFFLYHHTDAEFADAAWMAAKLTVDPDTDSTSWSYAQLVGITPSSLTDTQRDALFAKNGNVVGTLNDVPCTSKGRTGSGRSIDLVLLQLWYDARVSEGIAQMLLDASARGSKAPFDEEGVEMVRERINRVHETAKRAKHIVRGTEWIEMPELTDVPPADRLAYVLNGTKFGAEPTGAIEEVDALGYLTID